MAATPVGRDVHPLDLSYVVTEHAQCSYAGCLAIALGKQQPTLWWPVVIEVITNLGRIRRRLIDAEFVGELLVSPRHVVGHEPDDRVIVCLRRGVTDEGVRLRRHRSPSSKLPDIFPPGSPDWK